MTSVILVRHAESDRSVADEAARPLSQRGHTQASNLISLFNNRPIDCIYCSPYRRALQTLQPLADHRGLKIGVIDDFRERLVGQWEANFDAYSRRQWADFSFKKDGGDCLSEVQVRNIRALERILLESVGKNVLIGTHGTAMSLIVNHYDPTFEYEGFRSISNIMPYIAKLTFNRLRFVSIGEIALQP